MLRLMKFNFFNYLQWFVTASIMACFQTWADPPAAPETKDPPAEPVIPDDGDITMKDLTAIIQKAIEDSPNTKAVNELKEQVMAVEKKTLFPGGMDGDENSETFGKSVVDMSFFRKSFKGAGVSGSIPSAYSGNPGLMSGHILGKQLVQMGGPFKHLSPEMETFAKMLKLKGSPSRMMTNGIDVAATNESLIDQYKKAGIVSDTKATGMSEGVLADGGALVPVEYLATVIEFLTQQSEIIGKCWRVPMSSSTLKIPRLAQAAGNYFGGITLYAPDEGGLKTGSKPTLEQLTFTAKKIIGLVYMTDELIADSMINIVNYVTGLFVRAMQYDMEGRIIAGTGVGPCLGITVDPAVLQVARHANGTISYEDVIALDNAIDENIQDLSWLTRKVSQNTLFALRDTNDRPIFLSDYAVFSGQPVHPKTMISYPVYKTRNVPAMGSRGDLIIGDLSFYMLAIRQDMTIDTSEHVRFEYDEQTIRLVTRYDGKAVVPSAFAVLKASTS